MFLVWEMTVRWQSKFLCFEKMLKQTFFKVHLILCSSICIFLCSIGYFWTILSDFGHFDPFLSNSDHFLVSFDPHIFHFFASYFVLFLVFLPFLPFFMICRKARHLSAALNQNKNKYRTCGGQKIEALMANLFNRRLNWIFDCQRYY